MPSPEWLERRIMEAALGEGIIPFWYGDGERLTPDAPIDLEAYSGRWLRFERAP